jgi:hypothetical protein
MTVILPVSAKKPEGGGKSPTTVLLDGEIIYDGPAARLRDTNSYFSLTIGVESKKQETSLITYTDKWPYPFDGVDFESYKSFITIHVNKKEGNEVWMTCSHEVEGWVMWCKGTGVQDTDGNWLISINEAKTAESGTIPYRVPLLVTIEIVDS